MVTTGAARPDPDRLSPGRHAPVTVAEYHSLIDAGSLGEDDRVELLEGEIVEMSPQDKPHARALARLNRILTRAVGDAYVVRPQLPLTFSDSEPEPDLAVVRAADEAAATRHPSTALLVVEIADSSVQRDLERKARVYARAGVPEYWLVQVKLHSVLVLRAPDPGSGTYRDTRAVGLDGSLTAAAFPGPQIAVRTLFD